MIWAFYLQYFKVFWAFYFKCVGPFILSVLGLFFKMYWAFSESRKNTAKEWKSKTKNRGERNLSNSGVRRRRPSRRLASVVLKELLPVPTGYRLQPLVHHLSFPFQIPKSGNFLNPNSQSLTSLHSRIKAMANGWLWHTAAAAARPSSRKMPVPSNLYFFPLP